MLPLAWKGSVAGPLLCCPTAVLLRACCSSEIGSRRSCTAGCAFAGAVLGGVMGARLAGFCCTTFACLAFWSTWRAERHTLQLGNTAQHGHLTKHYTSYLK